MHRKPSKIKGFPFLNPKLHIFAIEPEKDYSHLKGTSINVYNWGEYISDGSEGSLDVNKEFTKRYGIKVNYTTFESNENMYNKLQSGGANYDVIIPSEYMIARLIEEEMLLELDFSSFCFHFLVPPFIFLSPFLLLLFCSQLPSSTPLWTAVLLL